jgi:osmotically-inducible protein OsmY
MPLRLLGVLLVVLPPLAPAAAPTNGWKQTAGGRSAHATAIDCRLTLYARQALNGDSLLADLNLGVTVRDHVATLWGPIPSRQLAGRAVERLRTVQGIAEVINDLRVETREEPLDFFPRPTPPPKPNAPAPLPPGDQPLADGALAGRTAPTRPVAGQGLAWRPGRRNEPPKAELVPRQVPKADEKEPRAETGADTPLVLPPLVVPPRPADIPSEAAAVLMGPVAADAVPTDLVAAIDRLCKADDRFLRVRPEVREGVVYLRGSVPRGGDRFALAQAIARLPGVRRVVVEGVTIDGR